MQETHLGHELKQLRGKLALTQADLGDRLGVSSVTVARWENGDRGCSKAMLEKIRRLSKKVSIADVLPEDLARLSPTDALRVFQHLFFAESDRAGIPPTRRHITLKESTADGGVDAWIDPGVGRTLTELPFCGGTHFQIKSGSSFKPWQKPQIKKELFKSREPSKSSLGKAVLKSLEENGCYCLVTFGHSLTKPQRDNAFALFRSFFSECGFPNARIEILDQANLIDLLSRYPSLCVNVRGHRGGRYRFFDEWELDPELRRAFFLGEAQQQLLNTIREMLRGNTFRHVRIFGEPGLGKTRLVLESLSSNDLKPFVVYFDSPDTLQGSDLFNTILRRDDGRLSLLVVDDCSPEQCRSIWRQVLPYCDRIRLVTIDHDCEPISDAQMRSIECPSLEHEKIEAILQQYGIGEIDASRWVEMCSGSPRMAHLIGENHKNSTTDALATISTTDCWQRIISACARDHAETDLVFRVLRHLALFEKFGYERPVHAEADFIFDWVHKTSPDLHRAQFDSIIGHLRKKRILQGTHTLFIVPRALQVYLWTQFWERDASRFNLPEFFNSLPSSLVRWFTANFKFAHRSERARRAIVDLLSDQTGIQIADLLGSEEGCKFIADLAEADPVSTVRALGKTLRTWSKDKILIFTEGRQHIVWALEKCAVWPETFHDSARQLAILASGENASNGNNSTGVFRELFSLAYGPAASTEVAPAERWRILESLLESSDPNERLLAANACDSALITYHSGRMIGAEHQGLRPTAKLWLPKSRKELIEAYRHVWKLLANQANRVDGDERKLVVDILIRRSTELLSRVPPLVKDIEHTVLTLLEDKATDLRLLVRNLQWLKRHGKLLTPRARRCAMTIERRIAGTTFRTKLRRLVLLSDPFDDYGPDGEREGLLEKKIELLASACVDRNKRLVPLLSELVCEHGYNLALFGEYLGRLDESLSLLQPMTTARKDASVDGNEILLGRYLHGIRLRGDVTWENSVLSWLSEERGYDIVTSLSCYAGFTHTIIQKLLTGIDSSKLSLVGLLRSVTYSVDVKDLPDHSVRVLLERSLTAQDRDTVVGALQLAERWYDKDASEDRLPHDVISALVRNAAAVYNSHNQDLDWIFQYWVRRIMPLGSTTAIELLRTFLMKCEDWRFELHFKHSMTNGLLVDIVTAQPKNAWTVFMSFLGNTSSHLARNLQRWLSPSGFGDEHALITEFPECAVIDWALEDPEDRAPYLARVLPTEIAKSGPGKLTRECLLRFGHLDDFRRSLLSHFQFGGYQGPASKHYSDLRETARGWLAEESALAVREWLEWYIDSLTHQIEREKIQEERDF
jgi:transcriptional regulator with XRE-family HTH domain